MHDWGTEPPAVGDISLDLFPSILRNKDDLVVYDYEMTIVADNKIQVFRGKIPLGTHLSWNERVEKVMAKEFMKAIGIKGVWE